MSYIKRLEDNLNYLSKKIETIEWSGTIFVNGNEYKVCPVCHKNKTSGNENGHDNHCWLANQIYK